MYLVCMPVLATVKLGCHGKEETEVCAVTDSDTEETTQ